MSSEDEDSKAILSRRALLIQSALVGSLTGAGSAMADEEMRAAEVSLSLWVVLVALGVPVLAFVGYRLWRRRRESAGHVRSSIEPAWEIPECGVCKRRVPEELWGFQGEFCMEADPPDCPYHQPPARGRLVVLNGPLRGVSFAIKEEIATMGREPSDTAMLKVRNVTKQHAAIRMGGKGDIELRDFWGPTWVNGVKVSRVFLEDGARIALGETELRLDLPKERALELPDGALWRREDPHYQRLLRLARDGDRGAATELLRRARRLHDTEGEALARGVVEDEEGG